MLAITVSILKRSEAYEMTYSRSNHTCNRDLMSECGSMSTDEGAILV